MSKLPADWPYGVEIRNKEFLRPEYFDALRKHNVTHVYNSWAGMPSVGEQTASVFALMKIAKALGVRLKHIVADV